MATVTTCVNMGGIGTGVCRFQLGLLGGNRISVGVLRDLANSFVEISLAPERGACSKNYKNTCPLHSAQMVNPQMK